MPFKSKAKARYMFSEHPEMAKEWASKTPSIKDLPDKKTYDLRTPAMPKIKPRRYGD